MSWTTEETRQTFRSGKLIVGAIYPPLRPGLRWRWSIWVTGRRKPSDGWAPDEATAHRAVEAKYREFLKLAGLIRSEGGVS